MHTLCQNKTWRQINSQEAFPNKWETEREGKRNLWHLLFVKDMKFTAFFLGQLLMAPLFPELLTRKDAIKNMPDHSLFHVALKETSLLQHDYMQLHFRKPVRGMLCSVLNSSTHSMKEPAPLGYFMFLCIISAAMSSWWYVYFLSNISLSLGCGEEPG